MTLREELLMNVTVYLRTALEGASAKDWEGVCECCENAISTARQIETLDLGKDRFADGEC